ncbi:hypothetical protein Ciccas_000007 [Cichlidogyrus casuarinus]|uniref:Uncharacterized protein n=1 Tax=Cichlidogyrus casuarinus TaxID=1844966 RepID=A0ABD2QP47_9PLAT
MSKAESKKKALEKPLVNKAISEYVEAQLKNQLAHFETVKNAQMEERLNCQQKMQAVGVELENKNVELAFTYNKLSEEQSDSSISIIRLRIELESTKQELALQTKQLEECRLQRDNYKTELEKNKREYEEKLSRYTADVDAFFQDCFIGLLNRLHADYKKDCIATDLMTIKLNEKVQAAFNVGLSDRALLDVKTAYLEQLSAASPAINKQ